MEFLIAFSLFASILCIAVGEQHRRKTRGQSTSTPMTGFDENVKYVTELDDVPLRPLQETHGVFKPVVVIVPVVTAVLLILGTFFLSGCGDSKQPVQQQYAAPPVQAQQGCWDTTQPCQTAPVPQSPNVIVVQQPQQQNSGIDPMTAGALGYMLGRSASSPSSTTTVIRERTVNVPPSTTYQNNSSTAAVPPAAAAPKSNTPTASTMSRGTSSASSSSPNSPSSTTMSRGSSSSSSSSSSPSSSTSKRR